MTIEQVQERVSAIREIAGDDEVAHSMEGDRLRALRAVGRIARCCGRLDELGQWLEHEADCLRLARHTAAAMGCLAVDIDDATMEGMLEGRALVNGGSTERASHGQH